MPIFRLIRLCCVVLSLSLLPACATLTTGTTQSVKVETPEVEGAACKLTDVKGAQWELSNTPGTVTVRKGDGPMDVICKKSGYKTTSVKVEESFHGMTLGNILIGGGIGIGVDAMSGAAQHYPDSIYVWMEKSDFTASQRSAWLGRKKKFEDELKAKNAEALEQSRKDQAARRRH